MKPLALWFSPHNIKIFRNKHLLQNMNESILLVSDQAEICPEEYQDTNLFKNYTNIPSLT